MSKRVIRKFDPKKIKGERWGKLEVVRFDHDEIKHGKYGKYKVHYVLFHCECGKEKILDYYSVASNTRGAVRSCGCAYYDKMKDVRKYPDSMRNSPLYNVYHNMVHRCYDIKDKDYHKYGARGIYVCDDWIKPDKVQGYMNFYNWAINSGYAGYEPGTPRKNRPTLDRIDNNGPYAPWNCRWTTYIEQANNRRSARYITDLDGEVLTWAEFDRKHNLPYRTTKQRKHLYKGQCWSDDAVLYASYYQDRGIRKKVRTGEFIDKDGFKVLIPTKETLRRILKYGS